MPIYEYRCAVCGHDFEMLVRNSDRPACPECDSTRLDRKFSVPARPGGGRSVDFGKLGPPGGGGCGGGNCGCH
ncbi:MAG TPA: zinc ribbon domain-containing protein [Gemmatimonadales bacterium]|nr:zinc ribbon domain-containing protein [Gemmatimonadales bacterium]